jgi:hypothetical protein
VLATAISFTLLFLLRHWYWHPDEDDNLLGGWLVSQGWTIYRDFWEQHMPLPYYAVGAVFRFTPARDPGTFSARPIPAKWAIADVGVGNYRFAAWSKLPSRRTARRRCSRM